MDSDLRAYLDRIDFPTLAPDASIKLYCDISLEDIQEAIAQLQPGKAPGANGIPVKFYSLYQDILAPRLASLFAQFSSLGSQPGSMSEVVIVLLPKPGKDSEHCTSYRPISLLNVDAKILAKILANQLLRILGELIHVDKIGFMPGRGTINRRLS